MNEIRNFNQSLLYYTVTNSQLNPSHLNNDPNISNNLFNDLNVFIATFLDHIFQAYHSKFIQKHQLLTLRSFH